MTTRTLAELLPDPSKPRFERSLAYQGRGALPEISLMMWCPACQRWHTTTYDHICAAGHDVLTGKKVAKGRLFMSPNIGRRLQQLGVRIHRDGSATVNGERLAPPKLTSEQPLEQRIAALEARLTKGGRWIDAEDAWLKAHVGDPDWQRRSEEFERQLGRYTALLHELAVLEQAAGVEANQ